MSVDLVTSLNAIKERPQDPNGFEALGKLLGGAPELPGDSLSLLDQSREYHREREEWVAVLGLIDVELGRPGDGERRATLLALKGQVLREELLEETAALDAFREALELRPDDEATREALEEIELVRENWERVAEKYSGEAEEAGDPQLAAELYTSAAEVIWRNDPSSPKIEELLRRALEVDPRSRRASVRLERLLWNAGRHREVADLLERRLSMAGNPVEQEAVLISAGELWAKHLEDADAAADYLRRALAVNPTSIQAMRLLVDLYTAREDWRSLTRVYEDALRLQPARDVELGTLLQIGMLHAHKLDDWERAEEYFRRVRKAEPLQPVMLGFYRDFYRRREEPAKILALLDSAQRAAQSATQRAAIAVEMADVAEKEVGNLEKAIDIWKSIQRMELSSEQKGEATEALKRLYRRTDPPKWNALRELLKDEIDALPEDAEEQKIALLMQVVEIYRDHLRLDVMVINTYNAILAVKPDHEEALAALSDKYEAMGRWNELIALLQRQASVDDDGARKIATLHRIADLWTEKFGNQSQAIAPLEQVLELDAREPRALQRLREIFTKRRNWRGLVDLLAREASCLEGEARRAAYREMAEIAAERMGDPVEGIQVWNRVLADDPHDREALEQLTGLYRREGRWPALAEVLHRRYAAAQEQEGAEAEELLDQLGDLYTNQLRAVPNAIEVWRLLLARRPGHAKALAVLRELYVQQRRWNDLEELLGGAGEWAEFAETLTAAADRSGDAALKIELYRHVGDVCRDRLDNADRAIKAYERVLAIDPEEVSVARALVPLYRDVEKWGRLLAMYELLLGHAETREEQLQLLAAIREVYEQRLGSRQLAFQWCVRAFAIDPEDDALKSELERLAAESDAWEELVDVYRERVSVLEDAEPKRRLLRQLAQLCQERLHRQEDAEGFYRELLALQPEDLETLAALEQIYASTQRWAELVEILKRRVTLSEDVAQRIDLLFKIAFLQEERLGDAPSAIEAFRAVLELDDANAKALRALERLYQARAEWEHLEQILRREIELADARDVSAGLWHKLGELYADALSDAERAAKAFGEALAVDPAHRASVLSLEPYLMAEGDLCREVAGLLRPFYERAEDWPRLCQVLQILLAAESEREPRLGLLKRLLPIFHRRLEDADSAFTAAREILLLDPTDGDNRRELSTLAERVGRVRELADALSEALAALPPDQDLALEQALLRELATVYDERLGEPEAAEPHLRRLLEIRTLDEAAFAALERILRDSARWGDLRALLEQWHDASDDLEQRKSLLLQVSVLNEDVLGDTEAAIASYERIFAVDPEHEQTLRALERHYRATARWEALAGLLAHQVDRAPDAEARRGLKVKLAEVRAQYLEDADGAVDLLEEVVAAAPENAEAVEHLEVLLAAVDDKLRIARILESVYERIAAWPSLRAILDLRRSLVEQPLEAVELLTRAAEVSEERLEDSRAALTTYLEALRLAPGSEPLHRAVERLATALDAWDALADGWRAAAEVASGEDVSLQAQLLNKLATVELDCLGRAEDARRTYERLLALDPENAEIGGPAARALTRLYEDAGLFEPLIEVLTRLVEWSSDGEERERLHGRIAAVHESLGNTPEAIASYRAWLGENPRSGEALDALERLYLGTEQWGELIGVFNRRVELTDSAEARSILRTRIAEVHEQELHDTEEAIAAYVAILDELPQQLEALRALARLYRAAERWPDLLEMLERQIPLVEEERALELTYEVASLQHRQLLDTGPAVERYRAVLRARPDHDDARLALEELVGDAEFGEPVAEILAGLYEQKEWWQDLARVVDLQASRAEGPRRVALLRRAAELAEERLGDQRRAFEAYRATLAGGEEDLAQLVAQTSRLAVALELWGELADALEQVVVDVLEPALQQSLHLQIAELARDRLADAERARQHYQQVLDGDPQNEQALEALEGLYRAQQRFEPLLEIVHRRAELAGGERAARFVMQAAALWRNELERPEEAIPEYERALALVADLPAADPAIAREAVAALDQLYEQLERWTDLDALILRQLEEIEEPEQRLEQWFRLGRLRAERLNDDFRALEAYREVLRVHHDHAQAVAAMEAYLEQPELQAEAALVLEPLYVGRQDWTRLIRIYQIRLDAAEEQESRLALRTRIAQLYEEQLEDLEQAFLWYGSVFKERPQDRSIRDQLSRLAGILDRWDDLAEVYETGLQGLDVRDEVGRELALLLAGIYDDRLYRWEPARECFERILEHELTDEEVFPRLERLLMRYERWEELLAFYQRVVEASVDPELRRDLMLKICRVWEEALENLPEAIDAYRALLDLDETDADALGGLDRLYTEVEQWGDLCELLERQMPRLDGAATLEQHFRLGTICEAKLLDFPRAIDYYEEVLRQDPGHGGALARLEGLVLDREQRFRIARILEPIYEAQDEWAKLVVIYDAQLEFIDDPDQRLDLLKEIARLHEERGGSLELAFRALCRAFETEPSDNELLDGIRRLADRLNNWPEVIDVLRNTAENVYDHDQLGRIHAEVAVVREERLGDQEGAVAAWRDVLNVKEADPQAIAALQRLLTILGRYPELVEILRLKAERTPDPDEQRGTYRKIAEVSESQLGLPRDAIDAWRMVLGIDDADQEALDALERLFVLVEDWHELVAIRRRKIETAQDFGTRLALQLQIALTFVEKLEDNFEAIAAYKTVLEWDADNAEALEALDGLYSREGLWSDLLEVVELKAINERDDAAATALIFRAGAILAKEIGDTAAAIDRFEQVLAQDLHHAPARAALEEILPEDAHRERVAGILEGVYEKAGEVGAIVHVLHARLEGVADPALALQLWTHIGRLQEEGLADLNAAFDAYLKGFGAEPADEEVLATLERLAGNLSRHADLVNAIEDRLDSVYDADLGRRLHLKVADLLENVVGDDARAEGHYRAAMEGGGPELEPLQALDRVLSRLDRRPELLEILERLVEVVDDPDEQAEIFCRIGALRRDENQDLDGAFGACCSALERQPAHAGARAALEALLEHEALRTSILDVLEPLFEDSGEHTKLVEMLEIRLGLTADRMERVALLGRIAEIHEERLSSPGEALATHGRALAEDPQSEATLGSAERLADGLGRWAELAALAEEIIAEQQDPEVVRELGLRVAGWYEDKLNNIERAEAIYSKVLEVAPGAPGALAALERLYRATGRDAELADVLWQQADAEYDGARKRQLLAEVARLREHSDPEAAVRAWRAVLDVDAGDGEALDGLLALHREAEQWDDVLDVLDRKAAVATADADRVALKLRAVEVLIDRLGDSGRAVDVYRDILDLDPQNRDALLALEGIYTQQEDWTAVQGVLQQQLDVESGNGALPVYFRLVELARDKLEDVDQTAGYLHQILAVDPDNAEGFQQLESLLRASERWHDLVELLRSKAERLEQEGDRRGAVTRLLQTARIWTEKLDNPDAAAEVLEEVLQRDENHVGALTELARIHEATKSWDAARECLERAAGLGPDAAEAAELEFRLGRIAARQGEDPELVSQRYEKALSLAPGHVEATEALLELAREQERWDRVSALLESSLDQREGEARYKVLCELGELYGDKLGDAPRSVSAWERARELKPEGTEVLAPLAEAYYLAERFDDVTPLLERLIEQAGTRRTKAVGQYHFRLGCIAERRGDADGAAKAYEQAYRCDSTHVATLAALGKLYFDQHRWDDARRIYRSMLLQSIDEKAGITRADIFCYLGQVHAELGERDKAKGFFQRGLESDPEHAGLKAALEALG